MQVSKWGNSFAIRIPKDVMKELDLKEGDDVQLRAATGGVIEVVPDNLRRVALERLRAVRINLPPNWKFDRDEANER